MKNSPARMGYMLLLVSSLCLLVQGCDKSGTSIPAAQQDPFETEVKTLHSRNDLADTPSVFTAKLAARNKVSLRWIDEFKNERGYIVERSDGGGNTYVEIARVDADVGAFDDIRLKPSTTYHYRIRAYTSTGSSKYSKSCSVVTSPMCGPVIIDHTCTDLAAVPVLWIKAAKNNLHIAYGHTSYGSQLITGMSGLAAFRGNLYAFQEDTSEDDALDLRAGPFENARDLGDPDRTAWAEATRAYLEENPEINVVVWSWGSQADTTEKNIDLYLSLMEDLEEDYPSVVFVYMTGHLDGTGSKGNLHLRNEQIRDFCRSKGKVLYDFADIESYDPDGEYYGNRYADAGCGYDSNMDGKKDANWAVSWQTSHTEGEHWYGCYSAHSQALNANLKAYGAWWLWARLAGWDGK